MDGSPTPAYRVNELTPDPSVTFDPKVVKDYVTYAHRIANRGLVNSSVGGMVIRVAHPSHPDGVCYAKPQGISLEEVEDGDLVITDIPFGRILAGERATTVGHQMNREILRLRPDINATIHVHDDATIALLGGLGSTGAPHDFKVLSLDPPFVLGKPVHYVPAHVDVEADVSSVEGFIQDTNLVVLVGHGLTALGRSVSEAYHRLNTFTAEVRRCLAAEQVAALKGTTPSYRAQHEIEAMYRFAERIIYPTRADHVMQDEAAE